MRCLVYDAIKCLLLTDERINKSANSYDTDTKASSSTVNIGRRVKNLLLMSKARGITIKWPGGATRQGLNWLMAEEEESAKEWTLRLRTRPKQEPVAGHQKHKQHTAEELSSIQVEAGLDDLPAGQTQVFILQDQPTTKDVDALVLPGGRDGNSVDKRAATRQRKRQYNPYEDEEEVAIVGVKPPKSLLSKDDGEDKATGSFTLGELMTKSNERLKTTEGSGEQPQLTAQPSQPLTTKQRNVRRKILTFEDEPAPRQLTETTSWPSLLALDDDDLQRSLAKSRRQNVRSMLSEAIDGSEAVEEGGGPGQMEGLIFSESTDFISSVGFSTHAKVGTEGEDVTIPTVPVPMKAGPDSIAMVPDKNFESVAEPLTKEPLVRRGVHAALQYLAKVGLRPQLSTEKAPPRQRQRNRFADIKIEHYDAAGNLLAPKEAFKELSHKFHGKGPGKGKQERIQRRRATEQRILTAASGDTPLGTATALRERQKTTGESHIVLAHGRSAAGVDANAMVVEDVQRQMIDDSRTKGKITSKPASKQELVKKPRIFGMK
jgi:hypothetical protein